MTRISTTDPARRRRGRGRRAAGRPTGAEADRASAAIVQAAASGFARNGYAKTRTAEIAAAAGVSEGTLFHHFPTKRALLAEVGRREGDRVLGLAFAGVSPTEPPPDVRAMLRPLFEYARAEPDAYRVFAMDGAIEDLETGFGAKRSLITAGLVAMLEAWTRRGFVRAMEPERVADLVFALVDTAVHRLVLEDRWDELDDWLDETSRAVHALLFDSP